MEIKGYFPSLNLQGWSLTIRLFNVISLVLIGHGVLPPCRDVVCVFCSPRIFEKVFTVASVSQMRL